MIIITFSTKILAEKEKNGRVSTLETPTFRIYAISINQNQRESAAISFNHYQAASIRRQSALISVNKKINIYWHKSCPMDQSQGTMTHQASVGAKKFKKIKKRARN